MPPKERYMDRKLKTWEIALMFGILISVTVGSWLGREQQGLADSEIGRASCRERV